jgi:glycosyltransferase involved in cell wall biosynthesis
MKNRIGFIVNFFCNWTGGVQFLHLSSEAVYRHVSSSKEAEIFLIYIDKEFSRTLNPSKGIAMMPCMSFYDQGLIGEFLSQSSIKSICIVESIDLAVKELGLTLIAPNHHNLGSNFPIPWHGYIYDLQHLKYPQFFSAAEIEGRDVIFKAILKNSNSVFVNSLSVKSDLHLYYPKLAESSQIKIFPKFIPNLDRVLISEVDMRSNLILSGKYFISCSQQWKHKQHDLIIKAFNKLLKILNYPDDLFLVFTGTKEDYRHPSLSSSIDDLIAKLGLVKHVKYLGLVDRDLQLQLIQSAVAIIQASLIEGGAGASGTLEAALLGVPIIASDITPNRELTIGSSEFFASHDDDDLANLMLKTLKSDKLSIPMSKDEIDAINIEGSKSYFELLFDMI